MPSEKTAHDRFRNNLAGRFNRINRVENPITPGMPDTNCCFQGIGEFWVEIKAPTEPKRPATPLFGSNHDVSRQQINWHLHQWQCGGRSYFLIDTDQRVLVVSGCVAERINFMTVAELAEVSLFCEPKPMRKEKWTTLKNSFRS